MATSANQTATPMNLTKLALANIQPSAYNPRKQFDEESLRELADSIRQQGVLQPINVRHIADYDRYEIVFGERRYKAAIMAGLEEIPATISSYSDEEAEEIAITENLHRKDVTPMEEANAYQRLIDSGRHDVASLALLFGKSESYIRSRLKFTSLIPEIAELMESDTISISFANEICRYGEDIQREVYEKHLSDEIRYNSWRGMKASEIAEAIQQHYTTDLKRYSFDKTVCATCPHNTNHLLLFSEGGCGKCTNRSCLAEKITSNIVDETLNLLESHPEAAICKTQYDSNATAIKRLEEMGFEVISVDFATKYPTAPEAPLAEVYDTTEDYEEALSDYREDMVEYADKCEVLRQQSEAGEISTYIHVLDSKATLCYARNSTLANTNGLQSDVAVSPIEKLDRQDIRNKEIAVEKTIADTKKKILEVNMTETKFSNDEERMVYYFLLSSLRKEHYTEVGLPDGHIGHHTDDEKLKIVANLNARVKAIIRRDYLIANFKDAYRGTASATMLLDFAKKHMSEELSAIENGYNEIYDKRHQRIEERKALLLKEQQGEGAAESTDDNNPDTPPTEENQLEEKVA